MTNKKKRIYKADDGKIFGVCKGIAEYFDIDPTLVRLAWAVLICCFGTGFFLYILCALILPSKSEVERDNIKEAEARVKKSEEID